MGMEINGIYTGWFQIGCQDLTNIDKICIKFLGYLQLIVNFLGYVLLFVPITDFIFFSYQICLFLFRY